MNTKVLVVALVMMCALVFAIVPASAAEPVTDTATQTIAGVVAEPTPVPYTVTITAPVGISGWALVRGNDNERNVGPVTVSTTAPADWGTMSVSVTGNHDRLWSPTVDGLDTAMSVSLNGNGWVSLSTGTITATPLVYVQNTPLDIPVIIRQPVTEADAAGTDYAITLTYVVSVTPIS